MTFASDIVSSILRRCEAAPDGVALEHGAQAWSYRELATEIARWRDDIRALPGQPRCLALEFGHGAAGIAALLGVLAAGRCAVPLDPRAPPEQKAAVYARTRAVRLDESGIAGVADAEQSRDGGASPAAAVLYFTSGSTGEPKAVVWPGRTLLKAAEVFGEFFELTAEDRHALVTPIGVAAVLAQVTGTLLRGGTLVLREARDCSISALADWLEQARITTLQTVPSLFRSLVETRRPSGPYPRLRAVKLGGEGVTAEDAERFATITLPGAVLVNGLGLTEAGFNVCWRHWRVGEPLAPGPLPVGRAVSGVNIMLETAEGTRLGAEDGDGEGEGEIIIGSPDLPEAYWDPTGCSVQAQRGEAACPELRTGDAGRWARGGELLLTGRLDRRLKIRGHAVQPEHIEQAALRVPGVTAAAVVLDGSAPRSRLLLFIEAAGPLDEAAVQRELALRLPEPARPARVLLRETLPRLAFGKLDRRALAASLAHTEPQAPAPAPRDFLARTLVGLFAAALHRKDIPPDASFFELGGDSLAVAELFADIERVLGLDLPLLTLREHPSVEALKRHLLRGGFNPTDHPVALVTPSPDTEALPVFAWAGAGSDVLALHGLAEHMGPSFAVYAIQHRGADGRRIYDQSVEQMAQRGLQWVRKIQPQGPYRLCGTSFGGLVALEAARQLRAAGESRVELTLFDTYGPGYPAPRAGVSLWLRGRRALRALRPLGRREVPGLGVLWQGLREKLIRLWARALVRIALPGARRLPTPLRYIFLQEACFAAARRYGFAPYDGPVTLFRVTGQPSAELYEPDALLGLGPMLRGPLRLETVEAPYHRAHVREPWVRGLAKRFAAISKEGAAPETPAQAPIREAGPAAVDPAVGTWDAAALWNRLAPWWHAQTSRQGSELFTRVALDAVEKSSAIRPGMRVLEIACGTGWFARRMSARGARVTAIDISDEMLRLARALDGEGSPPDYRCVDVTSPAAVSVLRGESFDLMVCNMALQDIHDLRALFRHLRPLLKTGGRFVSSFVHPDNPERVATPLGVPSPQIAFAGQPRPHIEVRRSLAEIEDAACRAGWQLSELLELPSPTQPLIAVLTLEHAVTACVGGDAWKLALG